MAKVSIIVPVYNSEKTLPACLSGLVHQTLEDIEIILVNDCSTDNSLQILLDCEKQFPQKVLVVNSDVNRGAGGARNVGLMYATGEYIGFVDSDDMIVTNMYEKLYYKALEGDYDIVDCGFYNEKEDAAIIYTSDELAGVLDGRKRSELIVSGGYLWSKILKKEFLDEIGFVFRENCILEDCETLMYVFAMAKSIGNVKEILYNYKYYLQSLSRRFDYDKKYNNMIETMDAMEYTLMGLHNYEDIREAVEYAIVNFCVLCLQITSEEESEKRRKIISYFNRLVKIPITNNKYVKDKINKKDLELLKCNVELFKSTVDKVNDKNLKLI